MAEKELHASVPCLSLSFDSKEFNVFTGPTLFERDDLFYASVDKFLIALQQALSIDRDVELVFNRINLRFFTNMIQAQTVRLSDLYAFHKQLDLLPFVAVLNVYPSNFDEQYSHLLVQVDEVARATRVQAISQPEEEQMGQPLTEEPLEETVDVTSHEDDEQPDVPLAIVGSEEPVDVGNAEHTETSEFEHEQQEENNNEQQHEALLEEHNQHAQVEKTNHEDTDMIDVEVDVDTVDPETELDFARREIVLQDNEHRSVEPQVLPGIDAESNLDITLPGETSEQAPTESEQGSEWPTEQISEQATANGNHSLSMPTVQLTQKQEDMSEIEMSHDPLFDEEIDVNETVMDEAKQLSTVGHKRKRDDDEAQLEEEQETNHTVRTSAFSPNKKPRLGELDEEPNNQTPVLHVDASDSLMNSEMDLLEDSVTLPVVTPVVMGTPPALASQDDKLARAGDVFDGDDDEVDIGIDTDFVSDAFPGISSSNQSSGTLVFTT